MAKEQVKTFLETTSIKGVSRAVKSESRILRVAWIVCVVFGLGMTAFTIHNFMSVYLMYNVATSIEEDWGASAPFPSVTLCISNPPSVVFEESVRERYYARLRYLSNDILTVARNMVKPILDNANNVDDLKALNYMDDDNVFYYGVYLQLLARNLATQELVDYMYVHNVGARKLLSSSGMIQTVEYKVGTSPNKTILRCVYTTFSRGSSNCTLEAMEPIFINPEYPACYTLKVPESLASNAVESLSFIVYLDDLYDDPSTFRPIQEENPNVFSQVTSGVKLIVHEPDTLPLVQRGLDIPPGVKASVKVRGEQWTRLPEPYSRCLKMDRNNVKDILDMNYTYTDEYCRERCLQMGCIKQCDCIYPNAFSTLAERRKMEFCGYIEANKSTVLKRMGCMLDFEISQEKFLQECSEICLIPCDSYNYAVSMNQAMWPHRSFFCSYYKAAEFEHFSEALERIAQLILVNTTHINCTRPNELILAYFRDNFLLIEVKMDKHRLLKYNSKAVLSLESFLGSLGGALNLWIGITFVTLVEITELFYKLVVSTAAKSKSGSSGTIQPAKE